MPGAVRGLELRDDFPSDVFFKQVLGNPVDMIARAHLFTAGGIFERFPKLRVAFLEANGGWIVPMLERLDHHYEIWRTQVPYLKHKPSELFRRSGYISFDADEKLLRITARAARRRPHHLGVRLPAPRRQDAGRGGGAPRESRDALCGGSRDRARTQRGVPVQIADSVDAAVPKCRFSRVEIMTVGAIFRGSETGTLLASSKRRCVPPSNRDRRDCRPTPSGARTGSASATAPRCSSVCR